MAVHSSKNNIDRSTQVTASKRGPKKRGRSAAETPERTREHYIEALSRHHAEGFILKQGHVVDEPKRDYGYDVIITTFDYKGDANFTSGEIESGAIFLQLKATDSLKVSADGKMISFQVSRRHAVLWRKEPMPVYLVVYSVADKEAYWLQMQTELKKSSFIMPPKTQKDITVHLSRDAVLNEAAIEEFRQLKQKSLAEFEKGMDKVYV